jgi:hypothetical protein
MEDNETFTAQFDPRRQAVGDIIGEAWATYNEDNPAQLIADMILATSICAEMMEADISDIKPLFDLAKTNAEIAARHILAGAK